MTTVTKNISMTEMSKNIDYGAMSSDLSKATTGSDSHATSKPGEKDLVAASNISGLGQGQENKESFCGASISAGSPLFWSLRTPWERQKVTEGGNRFIVFPWSKPYECWWVFTIFCSVFTIFFETYEVAFGSQTVGYSAGSASAIVEYILRAIFAVDIVIRFNLAFYNERHEIVFDRKAIAKHYLRFMFWVDLIGVFPFYLVALAASGQIGQDSALAQNLSLLRLLSLVRSYRVKQMFDLLQYSTKVSLLWLTLTRNLAAALVWTHLAACIMYFIARKLAFDEDDTWIGGQVNGLSEYERYVTSLYWSVVTFTTVGYGDFSPVNSAEQIWGMIFMLLNIILQSWIIGSITLLIVKNDEKTGFYRDTLETLDQYASMHSFDRAFTKRLESQIKLDFNNREIADEQVLKHFPCSVRRRVLRRLYLPSLLRTNLMNGIRQQFVDAFLTTCSVEIFSPGEEILQRGSISSDLYLLVGGTVKLVSVDNSTVDHNSKGDKYGALGSAADGDMSCHSAVAFGKELKAGDFINAIEFFTESPQIDTIRTVSVCKTLTMSRTAYKMIAQDHPGSIGKILNNLLSKVETMSRKTGLEAQLKLPRPIAVLRAGSVFEPEDRSTTPSRDKAEEIPSGESVQAQASLTAVRELVQMHINKQKDDHTTRFLFASSRNDILTISLMCEQGLDANSADYDSRTALMVAAMKGNTEAVKKLLEFQANPNLVDMHGSSALYEAAKNGHEGTMGVLLAHGAELCMDESRAASTLCQSVFDGDTQLLRRLLRAGIQVNASDYDRRTAVHIAAAEGNVTALKVLHEFGADLTVRDRWNNSVEDEANRANAGHFVESLRTLRSHNAAAG